MSWITIEEGKAVVSEAGMSLPLVKKVHKNDKTKNKAKFESWMRFIYFSYFRESIYRNYLPGEREKKVIETVFPDKSVTYFKRIGGMPELIKFVVDSTYTFKEKLYRRLLEDIEESMERLSKIPLEKTVRVVTNKEITFTSSVTGEKTSELIPIDTRVKIDNTDEKVKSMDIIDKLLKREVLIKKALKEEQIESDLKKAAEDRMFDK